MCIPSVCQVFRRYPRSPSPYKPTPSSFRRLHASLITNHVKNGAHMREFQKEIYDKEVLQLLEELPIFNRISGDLTGSRSPK